jgi:hypothetical protein
MIQKIRERGITVLYRASYACDGDQRPIAVLQYGKKIAEGTPKRSVTIRR